MPAALFMALTRSIVRASVIQSSSPAEGIAHANRLICADATNGMFVTLFYAQVEPPTGNILYVNAGHNPPLLYRAESQVWLELERTGMVLGIDETTPFAQQAVQLNSGDFVLLYTDGVTEANNTLGQEFGGQRVRRVLHKNHQAEAREMLKVLEQAINNFSGPAAPVDDVTMVIIKRL
jgi:sigma-B regulation protein RsbU (phosphoserine phosphatase)